MMRARIENNPDFEDSYRLIIDCHDCGHSLIIPKESLEKEIKISKLVIKC